MNMEIELHGCSDGVQREAELLRACDEPDHIPDAGAAPGPEDSCEERQLLAGRHHPRASPWWLPR